MSSTSFIAARQRVDDPNGLLCLIEITHPNFTGPARAVNDTRDWVSNGETFVGLPFRFTLPQDKAKESPRAQLEIDNVGRTLTAELERLPPSAVVMCTVRLVSRDAPDTVEWQWTVPMTAITVNAAVVTATLGVEFLMRQPAVRLIHDPVTSPGIFQD